MAKKIVVDYTTFEFAWLEAEKRAEMGYCTSRHCFKSPEDAETFAREARKQTIVAVRYGPEVTLQW